MFACLVGLALASGTLAAADAASTTYQLDIPRQPAIDALKEFKRQTGRRVISSDEPPLDLGPIKGSYTAEAALTALLGTQLRFELKDDAFVILQPPKASATVATPPSVTAPGPPLIVSGKRPPRTLLSSAPHEIVLDDKDIELQSPSQVAGLLINFSQQPFAMNRRVNGAQFVEFRGLGIDNTVVTINGRRAAPTVGETTGTFDLGLLPIAAVASMNVTLEPTALEFGPPAAGGLLNIQLKNITEPTVELQYGGADGGATERRLAMATGTETDHVKSSILVEHFERDFLFGAARDRWRNQDYRRFGGRDYRVPASAPGNVNSLNGLNLPGLNSPFAAVPDGDADFQRTAGTLNLASLNRYYTVLPKIDYTSVVALAELDLGDNVTAFGEAIYTDRDVTQRFSPPVVSQILPAANPHNPFGTSVLVNALFSQMAPRQRDTNGNLLRSVMGLKGKRQSWQWEFAAVSTREDAWVSSSNDLDQTGLLTALAQTQPNRALNILDPTSPGNRELLEQLRAPPTGIHFQSDTTTVTGTVQGEVKIGGHAISTLFGVEREETNTAVSTWAPLERKVSSAFAQIDVPLSKTATLGLGSRLDQVSDVGDLLSPQVAFAWRPFETFELYAAAGKSERPASLPDLFQPTWLAQASAYDPSRDQVAKLDVLVGGNPNLEPVTARTFAAGFSWAPDSWLKKLAAKYWRIGLDDRITVPAPSFLLDHEDLYQDRVRRSAPTEGDIRAGIPGAVQLIDTTRINGGRLDTSGIDLETSLRFPTSLGTVNTHLDVTFVDEYASAELRGLARTERAGIASSYGTIPKWHAVASIELEREAGAAMMTFRYVPSYRDAYIEPTDRTIPSQTLVDLKFVVDLDRAFERLPLFEGLKLTLGVENVFDAAPHFAEVGQAAGFDMSQGDLRQRFSFVKVTHAFR